MEALRAGDQPADLVTVSRAEIAPRSLRSSTAEPAPKATPAAMIPAVVAKTVFQTTTDSMPMSKTVARLTATRILPLAAGQLDSNGMASSRKAAF